MVLAFASTTSGKVGSEKVFSRKVLCLFAFSALVVVLTACTPRSPLVEDIERHFEMTDRRSVDLAAAVPQQWSRVCIMGPYTNNAATHAALGFKWDSEAVSKIASDDTISLLIFVNVDNEVTAYANYPRGSGDFSNLRGKCFSRAQARFRQLDKPQNGWPGLFPI